MAKRLQIGSIIKSKNPQMPDYIKIDKDITLGKGTFLNLESKSYRLQAVQRSVENGKLTQDVAQSIVESIEKMPDFVRFNIILKVEDDIKDDIKDVF